MILLVIALAVGLFVLLTNEGCPYPAAALVCLCLAFSPTVVDLSVNFFSDPLFSVLALFIFLALQRTARPGPGFFLFVGSLIGLMYLTRTAGLAFAAGAVLIAFLQSALKRARAPLLVILPIAVAVAIWALVPKQSNSYQELLKDALKNHTGWFASGWSGYFAQAGSQGLGYFSGKYFLDCLTPRNEVFLQTFLPRAGAFIVDRFCALAFLVLSIHGFFKLKWAAKPAIAFVILVYLSELLIWPAYVGPRAILPLFPFVAVCVFRSLQSFERVRALPVILAIFLGSTLLINVVSSISETAADPQQWREIETTAAWMKDNLPKSAKIWASPELPLFHFYHLSGFQFFLNPYATPSQAKVIDQCDFVLAWGRDYKEVTKLPAGTMRQLFTSGPRGYQVMQVFHSAD